MTSTPPQSAAAPVSPGVVLDADEAADLAWLLEVIEDWLRHADHDTHTDLAGFLDGTGHGRLAAAGLLTAIGHSAAALHRRLRKATR